MFAAKAAAQWSVFERRLSPSRYFFEHYLKTVFRNNTGVLRDFPLLSFNL